MNQVPQGGVVGFVDQLPALIGVTVGAGMSYLATSLTDRVRWRRRQEAQWNERRLAAYADYSNAIKEEVLIISRLAAGVGLNKNPEPLAADQEGIARLAEAEARRSLVIETVQLLADPKTMAAVDTMNQCVWRLEQIVRDSQSADSVEWYRAYTEYADSKDVFVQCGRDSLLVSGSVTPKTRPWPSYYLRPNPEGREVAATAEATTDLA